MQSEKDFTVYIGNDAGDEEIDTIVESYKPLLNLRYKKFERNLGRKSLVQQWNRCLGMIQDEEWIWLLPDDDYPDANCISGFRSCISPGNTDVFRFRIRNVDGDNKFIRVDELLPEVQSSFEALCEKLSFTRTSSVAEYIFRRESFNKKGGFEDIPLAWGTDDLLWFRLGFEKGIRGINEAFVNIRVSGINISSDYKYTGHEKIKANFRFFSLLHKTPEFKSLAKREDLSSFKEIAMNHILMNLQDFRLKLPFGRMINYSLKGNKIWGGGVLKNLHRFYLNNKRIHQ